MSPFALIRGTQTLLDPSHFQIRVPKNLNPENQADVSQKAKRSSMSYQKEASIKKKCLRSSFFLHGHSLKGPED